MRWTRKTIIAEIQRLHKAGTELNYASAEANHLNVVRAAAWHFGTWRRAVEMAGIDYEGLSKYQRWDRRRIIARIRELHRDEADLSWRAVSTEVDPPLAAAALRPNGFASWRDAIAAAGLDINDVARYRNWSSEQVLREIKALHRAKAPLSSKAIQSDNQPLFCAARRRFGSWDDALAAAGLNVTKIRLRSPRGKSAASNSRTEIKKTVAALNGSLNGKTRSTGFKAASTKKTGAETTKSKTDKIELQRSAAKPRQSSAKSGTGRTRSATTGRSRVKK